MTAGARIRAWREFHGYTLTRLADVLAIDKGTLSKIERDAETTARTPAALCEQVAHVFGLSMGEFYGPIPDKGKAA